MTGPSVPRELVIVSSGASAWLFRILYLVTIIALLLLIIMLLRFNSAMESGQYFFH